MELRSSVDDNQSGTTAAIAVVGGIIMDLVFETERMPVLGKSLDASSLAYKPGGKGSNTSVAIYRAQHNKPIVNDAAEQHTGVATRSKDDEEEEDDEEDNNYAPSEGQTEVLVYLNTSVGNDAFGLQLKKNLEQNANYIP